MPLLQISCGLLFLSLGSYFSSLGSEQFIFYFTNYCNNCGFAQEIFQYLKD